MSSTAASPTVLAAADATRLLEFQRELLERTDRTALLRAAAEHAVALTGAGRAFLVLAERGHPDLDTAVPADGTLAAEDLERALPAARSALARLAEGDSDARATSAPGPVCVASDVMRARQVILHLDGFTDGAGEREVRLARLLADRTALALLHAERIEELHALGARTSEVVPIAHLEKRAILAAIEHTGGDKRRAARLLGISRAKVYQRLKDWREGKA